jgi:hypothetical protein
MHYRAPFKCFLRKAAELCRSVDLAASRQIELQTKRYQRNNCQLFTCGTRAKVASATSRIMVWIYRFFQQPVFSQDEKGG